MSHTTLFSIVLTVVFAVVWYIGYYQGRSRKIQDYEERLWSVERRCDFKVDAAQREMREMKATWPDVEIQRRVEDYLTGMKLNKPITAPNLERSVATDGKSEPTQAG